MVRKPTPEDRDEFRRRNEEGVDARREMQAIIARVDARLAARRAWNARPWYRRIFGAPPA